MLRFSYLGPDCLGVCLDGRGVVVVDLVREDGAGLDILREVEVDLSGKVPSRGGLDGRQTDADARSGHGVTDFMERGQCAGGSIEVDHCIELSIQRELQSLVRVDKLTNQSGTRRNIGA